MTKTAPAMTERKKGLTMATLARMSLDKVTNDGVWCELGRGAAKKPDCDAPQRSPLRLNVVNGSSQGKQDISRSNDLMLIWGCAVEAVGIASRELLEGLQAGSGGWMQGAPTSRQAIGASHIRVPSGTPFTHHSTWAQLHHRQIPSTLQYFIT